MFRLFFFLAIFGFCFPCNVWDNFYSNLDGPNLQLPNDFELTLPFISTEEIEYIIHIYFAGTFNKIMIKDLLTINGSEKSNMRVVADFKKGYVYTQSDTNCSELVMSDLARGISVTQSTILWNLLTFFVEEVETNLFKFDISCFLESLFVKDQPPLVSLFAYIWKEKRDSNILEKVELVAVGESIESEIEQKISPADFDQVDFMVDKAKCLHKIGADELLESMVYPFAQTYFYDVIQIVKKYADQYKPENSEYESF